MTDIVIAATQGAFLSSIGAMSDAHARLGEAFATNPALGDYATMQTRMTLAATSGRSLSLAGGRTMAVEALPGAPGPATIVYLPSFQAPDVEAAWRAVQGERAFHVWLLARHADGALMAACGAGILHLVAAGLFAGPLTVPLRLRAVVEAAASGTVPGEGDGIAVAGRVYTCPRDSDSAALVIRLFERAFSPGVARSLAEREPPAGLPRLVADPLVARAQAWMRDHFTSTFRLADLATSLGISHQALIRRFREAGQEAPRAHVQRLRIEAAAISLVETDRPVAEIAQLVGYADIPFFRKLFTARTGMTPGAWRRAGRGKRG